MDGYLQNLYNEFKSSVKRDTSKTEGLTGDQFFRYILLKENTFPSACLTQPFAYIANVESDSYGNITPLNNDQQSVKCNPLKLSENLKSTPVPECLESGAVWIISPLAIEITTYFRNYSGQLEFISKYAHANLVLVNTLTREIERFEPKIGHEHLDYAVNECIQNWFKFWGLKDTTFYSSLNFCPVGPQYREAEVRKIESTLTCAFWSLLYLETRLLNPEMSREDVLRMLQEIPNAELINYIDQYKQQVLNVLRQ